MLISFQEDGHCSLNLCFANSFLYHSDFFSSTRFPLFFFLFQFSFSFFFFPFFRVSFFLCGRQKKPVDFMYPCTEKKALPGTVPAPDRCKADQCTPKVNSFFLPAGWAFFLCFFERYESTKHITPSKMTVKCCYCQV